MMIMHFDDFCLWAYILIDDICHTLALVGECQG